MEMVHMNWNELKTKFQGDFPEQTFFEIHSKFNINKARS